MTHGLATGSGRWIAPIATLLGLLACGEQPAAHDAQAHAAALQVDPPVVISQVYGGGGNAGAVYTHDFVELFNRSNAPVALDTMSVQYASATGTGNFGSSASQLALFPAGATLNPGHYYLVQLQSGGGVGAALPTPDAAPSPGINMAGGAGKVALATGTTTLGCNGGSAPCNAMQVARIMDLVGYGGANYFETAATPTLSSTLAATRKGLGCTDTNSNAADFDAVTPAPRNGATPSAPCGGDQAPYVATTTPSDGATNVSTGVALQITFSEPVNASGTWLSFACNLSGTVTTTITGGPTAFTVTPDSPLSDGDSCDVTVLAASITDVDATDPPDAMVADYAFDFTVAASSVPLAVHTVQGAAHLSPYAGQSLNVGPAIVTAVRSNGFYMQDAVPDASDATSEGIFVFTSSAPSVAVGHEVTVLGNVVEYRPGCAPSCSPSASAFDNLTITELDAPTVTVLGTGRPLPAPVVLGSGLGERAVPLQNIEDEGPGNIETTGSFQPESDGIDFYESLEGMRVRIDSPPVIDPLRSFSGALEIGVLVRPDAGLRTPRGGIIVAENDFNPERLFLSNKIISSFPTVNVGASFDGAVVGVVDYDFANYKLIVSDPLPPVVAGSLTQETTALSATLPLQLTVASLNVENLDALDPPAKLTELAQIVVDHLGSPDLIALEEVQDNNGAMNNGVVDAASTLNAFTAAIASEGGPSYAYRQINPQNNQDGGEPGGNIRVVFLYRTDRGLAFVDRGAATATTANAVDTSGPAPQLTFSPGRIDPTNSAFSSSRKPLAGELTFGGKTFFVIANHWNSKGGDDPLFGRFQPPVLGSETQRVAQAAIVAGFVDDLLSDDPQARVIVLGDLNDFSFAPPVEALKAVGMTDLGETLPPGERYTYVYQGNSQDLDHIMVSPSLAAHASYDIVHANAEFSDQASDHDPSIALLLAGEPPVFAMSNTPPPVAINGSFSFQVLVTADPPASYALLSAPAGMTIHPSTGVVSWTANVVPGTYNFTVQASNGAAIVSKPFTVTVLAPNAVPLLPPLALLALPLMLLGIGLRRLHS